MKKFVLMVFLVNTFFTLNLHAAKSVWDGKSSDTSWYNENASEYHINSAAQFKGFAELVSFNNCSFEGKTVFLDCDIDLDNHYWYPIGLHYSKPFSGTFDGKNHSISNLLINTNKLDYPDMKDNIGLFGYANKATIKQVSVQGSLEIYGSGQYVGGIAASAKHVESIYSDISIVLYASKSACYIGTAVGYVEEIKKVYSKGEIKCSEGYIGLYSQGYIGGVAAFCSNMSECFSDVNISMNIIGAGTQEGIGGLAGVTSTISNAMFSGSIAIGNYNCNTDMFFSNIGGIGRVTAGNHLISAPDFMSYGRGFAAGKSVLIPSNSNAAVTQSYYENTWATSNEVYGTSASKQELTSGTPLNGFDTNVWEFKEGEYPSLISLKELIPKPTYTVTYYVDGQLYQVDEYKEGDAVTPPVDPVKEGYTFSGWDYIPPFIVNNSWIVNGHFTINSYVITYIIDGEKFKEETQDYNTYITPPSVFPLKQGYLFNWGEYPYKVPAHDVIIEGYYTKDEYEFVDLGLPSGLLWATKNVGAVNPEDYGYYFSWGETYLKESYYWNTYSYCNGSSNTLTKYCFSTEFGEVDNKYVLDENDDAVRVNWGENWRLPTEQDAMELYNSCSWAIGNLNGIRGCYITGPNGNSIFAPMAGYKQYKTTFHKGSELYLLLSTLYTNNEVHPDYGLLIYCDETSYGLAGEERSFGFSARAVKNADPSGVHSTIIDNADEIDDVFDIQGRKNQTVGKGLSIIRYKNGKIKKIIR